MSDTLVIQSHRSPLPYPWIERCLESVRNWCDINRYDYQFLGDELFEVVPQAVLDKTRDQLVIASDLARLRVMQQALTERCATVVWLDADFLIFHPEKFNLPDQLYAVGREVWVQPDTGSRLRVYKKVHNAFLMFRAGNPFLDFYAETAEQLLLQNEGVMPPQFIGPKLLTALHNIARLPVMETAGMLSPAVIRDLIQDYAGGEALALFQRRSPAPIAGANLCISSCDNRELGTGEMDRLIQSLLGGAMGFGE